MALWTNGRHLDAAGVRVPGSVDTAWNLEAFGGALIDARGTATGVLDSEASVAGLTWFAALMEDGIGHVPDTDDAFVSGRSSRSWAGHRMWPAHRDALGEDLIRLPAPIGPARQVTGMGSWQWTISAACEHPEAAGALLSYLPSVDEFEHQLDQFETVLNAVHGLHAGPRPSADPFRVFPAQLSGGVPSANRHPGVMALGTARHDEGSVVTFELVEPAGLGFPDGEVADGSELEAGMWRAAELGVRQVGLGMAIDVGRGHCRLARLRDLPVDVRKIDRSFVDGVEEPSHSEFVATMVTLGRSLGCDLVAEGIQMAGPASTAHRLGCRFGQGFHLHHPLAPSEVAALLDGELVPAHGSGQPTAR